MTEMSDPVPPPRSLGYGRVAGPLRRTWLESIIGAVLFALFGLQAGMWIGSRMVLYAPTSVIFWNSGTQPTSAPLTALQKVATQMSSPAFVAANLNAPGQPAIALTPASVVAHLSVVPARQGDVISISYTDHDPQRALAVSMAMVNAAMRLNPAGTVLEMPRMGTPLNQPLPASVGLIAGAFFGGVLPWIVLPFRRQLP